MIRPVVVGAGPPTRDGGVDLFLELAATVARRTPARFVWLGARSTGVARRLDLEVEMLGERARVEWLPRGSAPSGPGVVLAVTARSVEAAHQALSEVDEDTPVLGLASDASVTTALEAAGATTVRYPDTVEFTGQVLAAADRSTAP